MFQINQNDSTPYYEQLSTQILAYVSDGTLRPGDKLPSIRVLSEQLKINFNTVKKVIAQLEEVGVIRTVAGSGCFIADGAIRNDTVMNQAHEELLSAALKAKASGLTESEAAEIVKKAYNT